MDRELFEKEVARYIAESPQNYVQAGDDFPNLVGMRAYDPPIFAYGDALDPMFEKMKEPQAVGPRFRAPREWLEDAKTVVSIFLPLSEQVRKSNRQDDGMPSPEWLFARYEGQKFIDKLSAHLEAFLRENGCKAVAPFISPEFVAGRVSAPGEEPVRYASSWSERHVGFICGMGTFGLCRGLITEKGMAGRFTSIITDKEFPLTPRSYTELYERCTMCGACVRRCPVGAITLETGKDHGPCSAFLDDVREKRSPRYGCGKCQTRVPCEYGIPEM